MKCKFFFTLFFIAISSISIMARIAMKLHIESPGTLTTLLSANKDQITNLTLTGTINEVDFICIKSMSALKNLDMSSVNIDNGSIPSNIFNGKIMDSLILPRTLKSIDKFAFANMTVTELDFSACINLESLGASLFNGIKLQKNIINLSNCYKLNNFQVISMNGIACTFMYYDGHASLPKNLTEIPLNSMINPCFLS